MPGPTTLDPVAQQIFSIGTALALTIGAILKYLPEFLKKMRNGKNNNGNKSSIAIRSGEFSPSDWERRVSDILRANLETQLSDVRNLLETRTEKIRDIVRSEVESIKKDQDQIRRDIIYVSSVVASLERRQ